MSREKDSIKRAQLGQLTAGDRITVSLTDDSAMELNAEYAAMRSAFPAATISSSALVNQCLCKPPAKANKDCANPSA